jgi:hypothetical protein
LADRVTDWLGPRVSSVLFALTESCVILAAVAAIVELAPNSRGG